MGKNQPKSKNKLQFSIEVWLFQMHDMKILTDISDVMIKNKLTIVRPGVHSEQA